MFSYGIILCEVTARVHADPEILPRTNVSESVASVSQVINRRMIAVDLCHTHCLNVVFMSQLDYIYTVFRKKHLPHTFSFVSP